MQNFLSWLAGLKGIPVERGAELQFELTGFPSGGLGLLTILGTLLAVMLVFFVYRRDAHRLTRNQRAVLAALRVLAILTALLVVLEPNLVTVKKDIRDGHSIILLDLSQSMGHRDAFRREEVQKLVQSWAELGQRDLPGKSRMDLAKSLLSNEDFQLIEKLSQKNKVILYGFAAGLTPLPLLTVEPELGPDGEPVELLPGARIAPHPNFDAVEPDGKYSNIGGAVRLALQKSRDVSIAAVIVLTDGRRNIGAKGSEVSRYLTQRRVDHTLVMGIGDPSEAQVITVPRIEAPERAFQKDPFKIRSKVTSQGYEALTVTVKLIEIPEGGGAGTLVQQKEVALSESQAVDVEFDNIRVADPGIRNYRVEVEPPPGEPLNPDRHTKQARVEILAEKTRVLLLAGSPLHEYQILRQLLTRDQTIDVSCWLESADAKFMQDGNTNLKTLPTDRGELEKFDVFIFMDPDATQLDREFCQMVATQVEEDGAGLWWICGEKYTYDALEPSANTSPIADLLPVVPHMQLAKMIIGLGRGFGRSYPFEITTQGRDHQAMRLVDADKDRNDLIWGQLPGWHFTFPVKRGKPAARILAYTKATHRFKDTSEAMPLIATHFIGAGRVTFSGTDETYRWRSRYGEQYDRYWIKGIRYLYEGRLTAGSSRLRIDISSEKLELGEPLKIGIEAKSATYQPLVSENYTLKIVRGNEPPTDLELLPIDGLPGQYEASYRPSKTGFYRVVPADTELKVDARFQVIAAAVEKEGPVNVSELGAIAQAQGGKLVETPTELLQAVDAIPSRTTTELFKTPHAMWDSWMTIAVILVLLSIEWWLRKRWNLL
ncbi:MAG: VWA domain-containing protein [Planctomycetota bacterium]|nr:VWA domain-containing protein [Planctomycetota bacterium]